MDGDFKGPVMDETVNIDPQEAFLRVGTRKNASCGSMSGPAPTLFFGHQLNDVSWVLDRPATTVQGTGRVGRPGHKDREGGESQFERESVRITPEEAAVLQSFPLDYPFQGSRTKRFEQVGNAIPPTLARHILAALISGPEQVSTLAEPEVAPIIEPRVWVRCPVCKVAHPGGLDRPSFHASPKCRRAAG